MSMSDPIADFLTRIRNGLRINRREVDVPRSRLKAGIAEVLKREGFIADYLDIEAGPKSLLRVQLKYTHDGVSTIREIKRVSKPGRRVYRQDREASAPPPCGSAGPDLPEGMQRQDAEIGISACRGGPGSVGAVHIYQRLEG